MYSPPHKLQLKESELMCLLKLLLKAKTLVSSRVTLFPRAPLYTRLSCLNRVKAGADAASAMSTDCQLTLPNERQVGPHSGVSAK